MSMPALLADCRIKLCRMFCFDLCSVFFGVLCSVSLVLSATVNGQKWQVPERCAQCTERLRSQQRGQVVFVEEACVSMRSCESGQRQSANQAQDASRIDLALPHAIASRRFHHQSHDHTTTRPIVDFINPWSSYRASGGHCESFSPTDEAFSAPTPTPDADASFNDNSVSENSRSRGILFRPHESSAPGSSKAAPAACRDSRSRSRSIGGSGATSGFNDRDKSQRGQRVIVCACVRAK